MIIRQILPVQNSFEVDHDDFAEAVMEFMEDNLEFFLRTKVDDEFMYVGTFVELDSKGKPLEEKVGRFFSSGIGRKGGVKRAPHRLYRSSLNLIEKELGCSEGFLSDADTTWDGAETTEESWDRKWNR